MIHEILFRLGIPSYIQALQIPLTAVRTIKFPAQLPNQIGWIYGLSTYCDGVNSDNTTLPTTDQADDLFVTIKAGATDFWQPVRLSCLSFKPSNGCDAQYYPVNIPSKISLDQSFIQNPTSVASCTVQMNLHYIDEAAYMTLRQSGWLAENGMIKQG